MNSSRDVTLCKQATFGVAMGNRWGGEASNERRQCPCDDDIFAENGLTLMTDSRTP